MLKTRTGGFDIGFRRGWSDWQRDLPGTIAWAKTNNLGVIDLGNDGDLLASQVVAAGLKIGSVDLKNWQDLISADAGKRATGLEINKEYIEKVAKTGTKNFFCVLLPEDPAKPRDENFGYAVQSLAPLAEILEANGAKLVIEGWPGPGALACTPEGYRALFKAVPSKSIGINFDPSHLLRMSIDALRFVEEFADRVYHVHGKDTEILTEGIYEYGTEQPPTFAKGHGFGSVTWRYTIPGHGIFRWGKAFEVLKAAGYTGAVSVELEDENYNGSEDGEKAGILSGAQFLASY